VTYIHLDGKPVVPSFRVERGTSPVQFDPDFVLVQLMHPYDIAQKLAEAGNVKQAFDALNGFIRREIDIKADSAIKRLTSMHVDDMVGA
jgi:hypothetical protein